MNLQRRREGTEKPAHPMASSVYLTTHCPVPWTPGTSAQRPRTWSRPGIPIPHYHQGPAIGAFCLYSMFRISEAQRGFTIAWGIQHPHLRVMRWEEASETCNSTLLPPQTSGKGQ